MSAFIAADCAPEVPPLEQSGGVPEIIIFAGSELLFPKLLAGFSFGFETEATFRIVAPITAGPETTVVLCTSAVTIMSGKLPPAGTTSFVVQVKPLPERLQLQFEPVGVPVISIPAPGPPSETVVISLVEIGQLFVVLII